jgi:hypothetical protein
MEGQAVLAEAEDSTAVAADADSFSLHVRKKTGAPPSPLPLRLRWEAIRLIPCALAFVLVLAFNLETFNLETLKP